MTCPAPPRTTLRGLRVLVVDDEDDVRLGLELLAASVATDVREAASGDQALEICRSWVPHLVLSDITMPGMSGIELLTLLGQSHPETRVVLITGFGTIELAVEAMQRGAVHFITKPFDNEEVLEAITRYGEAVLAREQRQGLVEEESGAPRFVGESSRMREVLARVRQVAPTSMNVLIQGESGTGKELIARAIHWHSAARDAPFLAVNSAALPDTLLEAELFGHSRGAFTGADRAREGIFAKARGGTVFLDEIALMSPAFQGKLLRVLQERTVVPLGESTARPVRFRLIAATSMDLLGRIAAREFREDLYYRLRVVTIDLPPLRERPEDILPLATHFLAKHAQQVLPAGADRPFLSAASLDELKSHRWPGNVRELENCIQRALAFGRGGEILPRHLGLDDEGGIWSSGKSQQDPSYEEGKAKAVKVFQRRFVERALMRTGGNVTQAADACGLTRAALQRIMRKLDIDRERYAG